MIDSAPGPIRTVAVLGGGSAGLLTALALQRRLPALAIRILRSQRLGVIGVGEATTPWLPTFLHEQLGLDYARFYRDVRPVWKLGNRLEWGPPEQTHFNYPFGTRFLESRLAGMRKENSYFCFHKHESPPSEFGLAMEHGLSPVFRAPRGGWGLASGYGYHIENRSFIQHLESIATERGIGVGDVEIVDVIRAADGDVAALVAKDGQSIQTDFFIDCSGFAARLIGESLGVPCLSYSDSLFCDTAVVGTAKRAEPIQPYTTATTMNHGWCWRIEFEGHISRGYVFSSKFCSIDAAAADMKAMYPGLMEPFDIVRFPTGRRERFWVRNVAAIGNAAGFVEPLESTGLQMVGETARTLANCLADSDCRPTEAMRQLANAQIARWWDDIRGFLAVHFKFNTRLDTPFWRACRADVELASAAPICDFYREVGPSGLAYSLAPRESIFGYGGYLALLIGQRAPSRYASDLTTEEVAKWRAAVEIIRARAALALPIRDALQLVHSSQWRWPEP